MSRPVSVTVTHTLGKDEARRRLQQGFARIQQQLAGGLLGLASFHDEWRDDCLHFEGGVVGQTLTGRVYVSNDSVLIQLDLPDVLALIANRIVDRLKKDTQLLLDNK